jgi:shikimate kinase
MKLTGPIVITGFMGCGKTEVARTLARRFDLTVVDLDQRIAEQHGRTAAQLIVETGEPAFRSIETQTLRELLEEGAAGVIALGGGAWITAANRDLIQQHDGITVWLDTPFELCWQRIEISPQDRPLGRTRAQAEQLYDHRRAVYQLAAIHLPVRAHETTAELVDRLKAHYQLATDNTDENPISSV